MYMTHRLLSAEASSQALSSKAVQQVYQIIQHAFKVPKHHVHSRPSLSMLTTVSQEIKYKNIAQEARHMQYLLHNPHVLNDFLSTERNDMCLADLKDVDKLASENTVLIPKLHQTFAQCLHASVSVLDGCPAFEVDFKNVVNSHKVETIGRLKPDIVVVDSRFRPSALSMLTFVEVLTGPIDDDTHIGKMLVYLNELLELNPIRGHVYGALTNLEHAAVYHCIRGYKIGYCQPIRMEKGGLTMLINLLLASSDKLGYMAPELNLQNYYSPVRVLGQGHNSIVYEGATRQAGQATERHAVKVFNLCKDAALSAFHNEREVLAILEQSPAETPGIQVLPRLIMTSAKYDTAVAVSIVTKPVASPITRGQLNERNVRGYLEGLRCLHKLGYVHCDIEPRHLCMSAEGCPAIIDLGEARALDFNSDSPRKAWTYRGTVRYAAQDILSAVVGAEAQSSGNVQVQRLAKHDLVAFAKSFWAIQWEQADIVNDIEASNFQAIAQHWRNQIDDSQVGSSFQQALHAADNTDYDGVLRALGSMCAPYTEYKKI